MPSEHYNCHTATALGRVKLTIFLPPAFRPATVLTSYYGVIWLWRQMRFILRPGRPRCRSTDVVTFRLRRQAQIWWGVVPANVRRMHPRNKHRAKKMTNCCLQMSTPSLYILYRTFLSFIIVTFTNWKWQYGMYTPRFRPTRGVVTYIPHCDL